MAEQPSDGLLPTPSPAGPAASLPTIASPSGTLRKGPDAENKMLEKLRGWFEEKGGKWQPGWRVELKQRTSGKTTGAADVYYFSPAGKRYRSRAEIARDFSLAEDQPAKKSAGAGTGTPAGASASKKSAKVAPGVGREEAAERARAQLAALKLPLALEGGVRVTSLGSLEKRYHIASCLWPVGFRSEWHGEGGGQRGTGVTFVSSIEDSGTGPVFRVTAVSSSATVEALEGASATAPSAPAAEGPSGGSTPAASAAEGPSGSNAPAGAPKTVPAGPLEVGSGATPDAAWLAAATRQQEALVIAIARSVKRRPHKKKNPPAPSPAEPSGAAAAGGAAAGEAIAAAEEAAAAGAEQAGHEGAPAAQQQQPEQAQQPPQHSQQEASPGAASPAAPGAPPAAAAGAGTGTDEEAGTGAEAGTPPAAAAGAGAEAGAGASTPGGEAPATEQKPLRELDDVDRILIASPPLAGVWGRARFGLAAVPVLQALEGLPGAEQCTAYTFAEERPSGWEAEGARLAKELARHSKAAAKAAKGVERKEAQLERASVQKRKPSAAAASAKTGGGNGGGGGDGQQKKAGGVGAAPAAAAAASDAANAAAPPAKNRKKASQPVAALLGLVGGGKDALAVARVLDRMTKDLEAQEAKQAAAAARAAQRAQQKVEREAGKVAEKQAKKEAREREREALRAAQAATATRQQQLVQEVQVHAAANNARDDELLIGAMLPPPPPAPLAAEELPHQYHTVLLEAWHLAHRFSEALQLESLPTLHQLEAALLDPASKDGSEGSKVALALVEFLVDDIWSSAIAALSELNHDIREADLRPHPKAAHPLPISPSTLPEAARRLLLLLASGALHQAREGGSAGSSQLLSTLEPAMAVQYLTAGPPPHLAWGPAVFPKGRADTAAESLNAQLDAAALADAESIMAAYQPSGTGPKGTQPALIHHPEPAAAAANAGAGAAASAEAAGAAASAEAAGAAASAEAAGAAVAAGAAAAVRVRGEDGFLEEGGAERGWGGGSGGGGGVGAGGRAGERGPEEEEATTKRLLRCLLHQLANIKGEKGRRGRLLCFGGASAAAAAKWARPCDLRTVAARVDAGFYTALQDPLAAFRGDVEAACALVQAGCNRHASQYAAAMAEQGAPEVAAMALSLLEGALHEVAQHGAAAYLSQHAPQRAQPQRHQQEGMQEDRAGEERQQAGGGEEGPEETDPILDLDRPFCPFEGCVVCWSDDDQGRNVLCDGCDCEYHTYCLDPPLEDVPQGAWLCPRCTAKMKGRPGQRPSSTGAGGRPAALRFGGCSGGKEAYGMAQRLGSLEYGDWTPGQRAELLGLLCTLVAESGALHAVMRDEEEALKDKRRELHAARVELKQRREEEAAAAAAAQQVEQEGQQDGQKQQAQQRAATAAKPEARATRGRDAPDLESLVKQISRLEHEISQCPPMRLEPLGLDRHWNRYWLLPAQALEGEEAAEGALPLLCIERYRPEPHPIADAQPKRSTAPVAASAANPRAPAPPPFSSLTRASASAPPGAVSANTAGGGGGVDNHSAAAAVAAVAVQGRGEGGVAIYGGGGVVSAVPGTVEGSAPQLEVGLYRTPAELAVVLAWLNPLGSREKPLFAQVCKLAKRHASWQEGREQQQTQQAKQETEQVEQQWKQEAQQEEQAKQAQQGDALSNGATGVGTKVGSDARDADVVMAEVPAPSAEGPGAPGAPAPAAASPTAGVGALLANCIQKGGGSTGIPGEKEAGGEPMQLNAAGPAAAPAAPEGVDGMGPAPESEAQRLRQELLQFEEGLSEGAYSPVLGSLARVEAWRAVLLTASPSPSPHLLMAALLQLEGFVEGQWLKPHWRPWAVPAPLTPSQGTSLSGVRLRFEAFKSAVRTKAPSRPGALQLGLSMTAAAASAKGVGAAGQAKVAPYPHGGGGYEFRGRGAPAVAEKERERERERGRERDREKEQGRGRGREKEQGSKKRPWWEVDPSAPSSGSGGGLERDSRAERAAKRAKQPGRAGESDGDSRAARAAKRGTHAPAHDYDADEELARRLQEQLNRPGRLTRSRLQRVSARRRGGSEEEEEGSEEELGYRAKLRHPKPAPAPRSWRGRREALDSMEEDESSEEEEYEELGYRAKLRHPKPAPAPRPRRGRREASDSMDEDESSEEEESEEEEESQEEHAAVSTRRGRGGPAAGGGRRSTRVAAAGAAAGRGRPGRGGQQSGRRSRDQSEEEEEEEDEESEADESEEEEQEEASKEEGREAEGSGSSAGEEEPEASSGSEGGKGSGGSGEEWQVESEEDAEEEKKGSEESEGEGAARERGGRGGGSWPRPSAKGSYKGKQQWKASGASSPKPSPKGKGKPPAAADKLHLVGGRRRLAKRG